MMSELQYTQIRKAFDKNVIMKVIGLYISNAFNKVWHRVLLHKLSTYATPGSIFAMILSFLSGRSIKFIFNAHSCEFGEIKTRVP